MNKLLNSVGIVLSIVGTIITLWTLLTTKNSEAGTWGEHAGRHEKFPKEKKKVKIGIAVITIGGVLQIVSQFV